MYYTGSICMKGVLMPLPLKPDENIYVEHLVRYNNYSMPTNQAAFDHYNIGFIVSGDRRWISNDMVRTGHAGDVGIAKPYVYHRNCAMSDIPYDRYMLKIRTETFNRVIDIIGKTSFDILCANYLHFSSECQIVIKNMFEDMLEEYNKNTPASQLVLEGMAYRLFFYMYDNHIPDESDRSVYHLKRHDERIQEAFIYVENNLRNGPSINDTARHVSLSTAHFSRLFKETTGVSYSDYVSDVRLEHARILLEATNKSIADIADKIGLSSGNYLCSIFKHRYGITPHEFRLSVKRR